MIKHSQTSATIVSAPARRRAMQTKTHHYTANAFQILGFTTGECRSTFYPIENHEPGSGMVGAPPSAELLARILDDAAHEGWTAMRSGSETPLKRDEVIELCQTDTASLWFTRSVVGPATYIGPSPAAPTAEESQRRRQRGQEAALTLPEWPRSTVLGRSTGMSA